MSKETEVLTTRQQILSMKEEVDKLVFSYLESSVDSLLNSVLQVGVSFDADSRETQEGLFAVASQRAELMDLLLRVVNSR